jgi:hypothetical protein
MRLRNSVMPTTSTSEHRETPATDAVAEATRVFTESSRRTLENSQAAADATRSLLDESNTISKQLLDTWVASAEGTLKAAFDLQHAQLGAALSLVDAAAAGQHGVLQQVDSALRQTQKTALELVQAQARFAGRLLQTPTR